MKKCYDFLNIEQGKNIDCTEKSSCYYASLATHVNPKSEIITEPYRTIG